MDSNVLTNIFVISAIYSVFFYLLSYVADRFFPMPDKGNNDMMYNVRLVGETLLEIGVYCCSIYILRPHVDAMIGSIGITEEPHAVVAAAVSVAIATTPWKSNLGAKLNAITTIMDRHF